MKKINHSELSKLGFLIIPVLFVPFVSSAYTAVSLNGAVESDVSITGDTPVPDTNVRTDSEILIDTQNNTSTGQGTNVNVEIMTSAQVSNEADLEAFSTNLSSRSNEVAEVKIESQDDNESQVVVKYKHRGKLFGFIPVTIKSITTVVTTDVDSEARVESRLSWWSFLVAKENYAKAELESRIKNNPTIRAGVSAEAEAGAKARVAEAIIAELEAHAAAQAQVESAL